MNSVRIIGGCIRAGVLAIAMAFPLAGAATADAPRAEVCTADTAPKATPAALSRPVELDVSPNWAEAAFRGLSCSRCNSATQFCVLNPIRYEYACAPLGSVACISSERTHWCPPGRGCWAGFCR
jgi:hypothetical protein